MPLSFRLSFQRTLSSVVASLVLGEGCKSKEMNLQVFVVLCVFGEFGVDYLFIYLFVLLQSLWAAFGV